VSEPPSAYAQLVNPDSARADSLRKAAADSAAQADSIAQAEAEAQVFGGEDNGITSVPSLLSGSRQEHPFMYNTSYSTLRARHTWDQDADFYFRLRPRLQFANRTNITIIEDPDVKRNTRNRATNFELGYSPQPGVTAGFRAGLTRNSDLIGIRAANSLIRNTDQFLAFSHFDKKVNGLPIQGGASYGLVNNNQPEFDSRGGQFHGDASSSGVLRGGFHWSAGGDYNSSRLNSIAPSDTGLAFRSNDHSTDHSGHATLSWAPRSWFTFSANGTSKRGQTERPETEPDPITFENVTVQERVSTDNDNADMSAHYRAPWGTGIDIKANLMNQNIVYAQDSTRTNITKNEGFTLAAQDTMFGIPLNFSFQNGTSKNDYTRRPDGYLQTGWTRAATLTGNRRVNARTNADFSSGITLDSRRYSGFIATSASSFAPSPQDVLRATGRLKVDYSPLPNFGTGLQGQMDLTRNINLDPTTSGSNTDQTSYAVTWRWGFTPLSWWTVSQDNSAGASVVTYPFSPNQDNINYIYQLRTSSVETLSPKVSLETHYNLRYLSRGTYKADETGTRTFGKSGGSDSYDLLLRAVYTIANGVSFDISQQTNVSNNFSLPDGVKNIDTQTKHRALFVNFTASPKLGERTGVTLTLRRTLTRDENITFGITPITTARPDDYWIITGTMHTFFDMP